MIVLDQPYVSEPLIAWLEESRHPVADNATARSLAEAGRALALVPADEAARRIGEGERLYTNSENALSWVAEHVRSEAFARAIALFKDKARMREALAPLNPDLFFKTCTASELPSLDFSQLRLPFVLKPSVGFCSMGVYAIQSRADWDAALADIDRSAATWRSRYPESVVGIQEFVLEGYVEGQEYAIDAYFDAEGRARVLNVFRHDFSSAADTSDRMYLTSADIVRSCAPLFASWLDDVNAIVGVRDFPVHAEVRVRDGRVTPIEVNPLRFAGLGGTDLSLHAYGFRTYEAYLNDAPPDFDEVLAGKEGKVFSMSLLNPPAGADPAAGFDYDALTARFSRVLDLRRFDAARMGAYGFLFLETDESSAGELDFLRDADLKEFLR